MLALPPELKAGALALPLVTLFGHFVGVALAALDLNGLYRFVGVVGIPILASFRSPAKELFNVFAQCSRVHLNRDAARACEGLSRCW